MNVSEFICALKKDRSRLGGSSVWKYYIVNDGYKIAFHYRICQLIKSFKILYPLSIICRIIYRLICIIYGCDIPSSARIGNGLKIDHPIGIVINSNTIIGDNCTIKSGVVIGKKDEAGVAIIGNNVVIGVHALIIGNISIGDNVDIAAGAIVTHNVPSNTIIRNKISTIIKKKEDKHEY